MDGAYLVDKPAGMTSAAIVRKLKGKLKAKRIGHAGTLDPMATGLLIVLVGDATRLQSVCMDGEKVYQGQIRLGLRTDTDDITGKVVREDTELSFRDEKDAADWEREIVEHFSGSVSQVPPSYSAIKVDGKRSYAMARAGQDVALKARGVSIEFERLQFTSANMLDYRIRCSKGTYVRSLARDIGDFLSSCACLQSIRRIGSGEFNVGDAHELDSLLNSDDPESCKMPLEDLVLGIPKVVLEADDCFHLHQGRQAAVLEAMEKVKAVPLAAVFEPGGKLQGLLESEGLDSAGQRWRIKCMFPSSYMR